MPAERRYRIAVKELNDEPWQFWGDPVWKSFEEAENVAHFMSNKYRRVIPSDDAGEFHLPSDDPPVKFPVESAQRLTDLLGSEPVGQEPTIQDANHRHARQHHREECECPDCRQTTMPEPQRVDVERLQAQLLKIKTGKVFADTASYRPLIDAMPALLAEVRSLREVIHNLDDSLDECQCHLHEAQSDRERLIGMLNIETLRQYHESSFLDPPSYHETVSNLWDCPMCVEQFIKRANAEIEAELRKETT